MNRLKIKTVAVILASLLLVNCGSDQKMATVTLLTGYEHPRPALNLMAKIANQMTQLNLSSAVSPACKQTQIQAAYAPQSASGSSNSNSLSFFPVTAFTTVASNFESPDPATWLASNSSFNPISIPAPVGVPLGFGIVGNLIAPSNVGLADQSECPAVYGSTPNQTYSFIGHANATLSGNTTLAIKTWILKANTAPLVPTGVCITSTHGGGDALSQTCPERDFYMVVGGSPSCSTLNKVVFTYDIGINGNTPVSQTVSCSAFTSGGRVYIPSITPMKVTGLNSAGTVVGSFVISDSSFQNGMTAATTLLAGEPLALTFIENGGVSSPDTPYLNYSVSGSGGTRTISLNWSSTYLADSY